jgi:iron complex outermembrane receptor protein
MITSIPRSRIASARSAGSTCVAAAVAMALAHAAGAAETREPPTQSILAEITVTGSRLQKEVSDVTTSISVLDEATLAEQFNLSTDLFDALNATVPGLNVNQGIRQGCETNIRGRPASFQVNGVPVNQDLRESNCNAMYQVSPFALERIEVVRGSTALYGAGAPGGVVNLITRRASSQELEIDGTTLVSANTKGSSDTREYNFYAGAGQRFERWDYYAGIAHNDVNAARTPRGGLVPREEYDSWSANGAVGFQVGETGELRFTGTFYREERGREYAADGSQNATDGTFAPVVQIENNPFKHQGKDQLYTLVASYNQTEFLGHSLALSGYVQNQEYLQRANFWDGFFGNFFQDTDTENERQGLRSTLARAFDLGGSELELEYGIDWVRNRFYRPSVDPATGEIIGFIAPETILRTTSGFVQSDLVMGRVRLSAGVRYEQYRGEVGGEGYDPSIPRATPPGDFDDSDLTLLNIGFVFDLTDEMQLYGGFSQGAELTQLGRAARGVSDPALITPEPATSDQYELGIRGRLGAANVSLAGFYSESDKASELTDDPSCAGQPFCPFIPLRSPQRFKGLEATLDWKGDGSFGAGGILSYQSGKQFLPDLGRYVDYSTDRVSPPQVTAYVTYEPIQGWNNRLQGTYYDSTDYFAPYDFGPAVTVHTDSVFLMDATSSYRLGPGDLTLSIANLLDKEYVNPAAQASGNFFYFMEQGRRVSLGYRVRL